MTSIWYENILSNFLGDVSDNQLASLEEHEIMEIGTEYLHKAASESYLRKCFSVLELDDNNQEIRFELKYETDSDADKDFVINALSKYMVYRWWANKKNNTALTAQFLGGAEQKFYSQSAHLTELRANSEDALKEAQSYIRDRNAMFNSHLGGKK